MADKKSQKADANEKIEREYIIPLRSEWRKVPRYKRTNKAVKAVKEFLVRHMKIRDRDLNKVRIDGFLNEVLWSRGIKNPPTKIKVKSIKDSEGIVRVELVEIPKDIKFKKERIEKRDEKAKEIVESKKSTMEKLKEAASGATAKRKKSEKPEAESPQEKQEEKTESQEEKKKETKEKKAAVIEAEKKIEKQISKSQKRTSKVKSPSQEKRLQTGYNATSRGK